MKGQHDFLTSHSIQRWNPAMATWDEWAGASCVQLLHRVFVEYSHTPLEVVYCLYFVQPCELMNMWVSFHPRLGWTESGAQLQGRVTVERKKRQIKNRLRTGRQRWTWAGGWRDGDGGGGGLGRVRGHVQIHVDTQRWKPTTAVAFGLYKSWVSACVGPSGDVPLKR